MSARGVERQELTAPEDGTLRIEIDGTPHQYLVDEDAEITIEWSKR
jgi:hypothetical protein